MTHHTHSLHSPVTQSTLPPVARAVRLPADLPAAAPLLAQVTSALTHLGHDRAARLFWVPGRIEVLGKHTDYAGGDSLVAATERGFLLAVVPRTDNQVRIVAAASGEESVFPLTPDLAPEMGHWSNYPMTVARRVARNFPGGLRGAEIAFASNLPPAAGMSSSSALMVGVFLALAAVNELTNRPELTANVVDGLQLAEYLGTVENGQNYGTLVGDKGVGTFGGSEDHTAILCSRPNQLGRYTYCPTRFGQSLPLPTGAVFAIGVSGVVAEKTGRARDLYNRASALAATATDVWNRATGRTDPHLAALLAHTGGDPAPIRAILQQADTSLADMNVAGIHVAGTGVDTVALLRRFDHFYLENQVLIPAAVAALTDGDLAAFGAAATRSQQTGTELLGNQVPETVALAELAVAQGATGASAFGAGFGGSVWALIRRDEAAAFLTAWQNAYLARFPQHAARSAFFVTGAGPAASELDIHA